MEEIQERMCRLCLQTSLDMENIFTSQNNYVQIVEDLIGIKMINVIELPSKICNDCLSVLRIITNFKENCLQNQKWLHQNYIKKDISLAEAIDEHEQEVDPKSIKICVTIDDAKYQVFDYDDDDISYDNDVKNDDNKSKSDNDGNKSSVSNEKRRDDDYLKITTENKGTSGSTNASESLEIKCTSTSESTEKRKLKNDRRKQKAKMKTKDAQPSSSEDKNTEIKQKKPYKSCRLPCHICGKFYTKFQLIGHLNAHNGLKPFPCPFEGCTKAFTSVVLQRRHHRMVHTDWAPYVCDLCGAKRKSKGKLDLHRSYHFDPQIPCNICGKLLRNRRALTKHKVTHTGEKPYKCEICEKGFAFGNNLKKHMKVHKNKENTC